MARAIDVRIMPAIGLVLDMRGGDGDAALALFGSFVDGAVFEVGCVALLGLPFGYCCCEGGLYRSCLSQHPIQSSLLKPSTTHLPMINVPNRANIDMRLAPLECGSVSSRSTEELRLARDVESALKGTAVLCAQGAGGAKEGPSERHCAVSYRNESPKRRQ